jgi:hypothetical protein
VVHHGPSVISIDTIYFSHGHIPDIFLRGAGVPDPMIDYMHSLVESMNPIDYYSCFISYSSKDENFANRLYADLQAKADILAILNTGKIMTHIALLLSDCFVISKPNRSMSSLYTIVSCSSVSIRAFSPTTIRIYE